MRLRLTAPSSGRVHRRKGGEMWQLPVVVSGFLSQMLSVRRQLRQWRPSSECVRAWRRRAVGGASKGLSAGCTSATVADLGLERVGARGARGGVALTLRT